MNDEYQEQLDHLARANVRMVLLTDSLQKIRDLEANLYNTGDVESFYLSFVSELSALTGAKYAALGMFSKDGKLESFYTAGIDDETKKRLGNKPEGKGLLSKMYKLSEPSIINNIKEDPDSVGFPDGHPDMTTLISMPLTVNEVLRGTVYLSDKNDGNLFDESDETIIKLLVTEIQHIYERTELLNELADKNILLEKEKAEQYSLLEKINNIQSQLLQSEKMASIGQLAAGVAHEINNPVGYINSNITSLDDYVKDLLTFVDKISVLTEEKSIAAEDVTKLKQDIDYNFVKEDIGQLLNESKEGVNRVKKIVQDLKDFSHVDEEEWQWTNLHSGIDSTLNVVNNEIKYKAEVIKEYGDVPDIECIASQVNQVFMNLLVNAAHSIENQGTITVRTGKTCNDTVWVKITDTGSGIKQENIAKLFEPFFTTKPVGQGTGLGLSLSYSIIQKHGGNIEVDSEINKGTTFTVTLPIKQPEQQAKS